MPGVLDLQIDTTTPGEATTTLAVHDGLKQPLGLVHGGVYATIADALATAATPNALRALSNQTSFLRPITQGAIHASAHRRHQGRTTAVWEVDITDDAGRLCALVRLTLAVRP